MYTCLILARPFVSSEFMVFSCEVTSTARCDWLGLSPR